MFVASLSLFQIYILISQAKSEDLKKKKRIKDVWFRKFTMQSQWKWSY